jgi:hypothetical protein
VVKEATVDRVLLKMKMAVEAYIFLS